MFSNLTISTAHSISHISPLRLFTASILVTPALMQKESVNIGVETSWLTGQILVLAGEIMLHQSYWESGSKEPTEDPNTTSRFCMWSVHGAGVSALLCLGGSALSISNRNVLPFQTKMHQIIPGE